MTIIDVLQAELKAKKIKAGMAAKHLGINRGTYTRKINNETLTINDLYKLCSLADMLPVLLHKDLL